VDAAVPRDGGEEHRSHVVHHALDLRAAVRLLGIRALLRRLRADELDLLNPRLLAGLAGVKHAEYDADTADDAGVRGHDLLGRARDPVRARRAGARDVRDDRLLAARLVDQVGELRDSARLAARAVHGEHDPSYLGRIERGLEVAREQLG